MWLDDDGRFKITDVLHEPPPYTILSHTWGPDAEEVTYQDVKESTGEQKEGWKKLVFCAKRTQERSLKYFWVDTCCIDKRNDAEIATAIRSMFRWYKQAETCFVYLQHEELSLTKRNHDGSEAWKDDFRKCRWFTRGWTLQELIAPQSAHFYTGSVYLGSRSDLGQIIEKITGISKAVWQSQGAGLSRVPQSARIQWMSGRETKVPEDLWYCLIGLCEVSLSPRYGEGKDAARSRLVRKIMKQHGTTALDLTTATSRNINAGDHQVTCLEWLKFDVMETRRTTIQKALLKTCSWILADPAYLSWTQPQALQQHHGFFWIKGKPGAGKSVMVKFLDTHIQKTKNLTDVCISFYFSARGESLEKTFVGMYRSLLWQLLSAVPELQTVLSTVTRLSAESDEILETLQSLLLDACLKLGRRRLYCFVDALDECQEQDVSNLVDFFQDLGQSTIDVGVSVCVCFASRHFPVLDIPTGLRLTLEDSHEHTSDLEKYARHKLKVGTAKQSMWVTEELLSRANGIFLWLILVIDILNKEFTAGRIHDVHERLKSIPQGLTELFKQITQRHSNQMEEHMLCLRWILYAKRPLGLHEFHFAMLAGLPNTKSLQWDRQLLTEDQMLRFLQTASKGLAELTRGTSPKIQFIHESVRDFLLSEDGFDHMRSDIKHTTANAHEILKNCCLRGIEQEAHQACQQALDGEMPCDLTTSNATSAEWKRPLEEPRAKVCQRFPFLDYATTFLLHHANEAAEQISQKEFLEQIDPRISEWASCANLLQRHRINIYKSQPDLVYLCAERDLARLISALHAQEKSLTQDTGQRCTIPLLSALANKAENAARELLRLTGSDHAQDIVQEVLIDNYKGRSAYNRLLEKQLWLQAYENGHYHLSVYLMERQREQIKTLRHRGRALMQEVVLEEAAVKGLYHVVKALLDHGVRPAAGAGILSYSLEGPQYVPLIELQPAVLQGASAHGHVDVVEILLDRVANIDAPTLLYGTALRAAASKGFSDVVKLLLARGADANAESRGGDFCLGSKFFGTALQDASWNGHIEVVRLLLENDVDVNAIGERGTALQIALYQAHIPVVHILLEYGADINTRLGADGMLLRTAAGSATAFSLRVKYLLSQREDAHISVAKRWEILRIAIATGSVDLVQTLLWMERDFCDRREVYANALIAATQHCRPRAIEDLLKHYVEGNSGGSRHVHALRSAAHQGAMDLNRVLSDRGADVGLRSLKALGAASKEYKCRLKIVRLLLQEGADANALQCTYANIAKLELNSPWDDPNTALINAVSNGATDVVEDLLDHGADVFRPSKDGHTAIPIAMAIAMSREGTMDNSTEDHKRIIDLLSNYAKIVGLASNDEE